MITDSVHASLCCGWAVRIAALMAASVSTGCQKRHHSMCGCTAACCAHLLLLRLQALDALTPGLPLLPACSQLHLQLRDCQPAGLQLLHPALHLLPRAVHLAPPVSLCSPGRLELLPHLQRQQEESTSAWEPVHWS